MKILIALAAFVSAAQADIGVDTTIRQFGDAFNKGDVKAAKALHVAKPVIIPRKVGAGAARCTISDLVMSALGQKQPFSTGRANVRFSFSRV
jgi:hypothetical protein